jgi:hypothetical protein
VLADVYDDHEEMQACEANPDPKSALGCVRSEASSLFAVMARWWSPLRVRNGIGELGPDQLLTVMLAPELLNALPVALNASDNKM